MRNPLTHTSKASIAYTLQRLKHHRDVEEHDRDLSSLERRLQSISKCSLPLAQIPIRLGSYESGSLHGNDTNA